MLSLKKFRGSNNTDDKLCYSGAGPCNFQFPSLEFSQKVLEHHPNYYSACVVHIISVLLVCQIYRLLKLKKRNYLSLLK